MIRDKASRGGPWGAAPAAPPPAPAAEAVSRYPCGACGAILSFKPGEHVLHCEFCGSDTPIPQADGAALAEALRERDFAAALSGGMREAQSETTQVARCEACGASVEFDPGAHARECPFCASRLVTDPSPDRHIRPQALLPFAIDAREARERLAGWLASRWFAPNGLRKFARADSRLNGIYTPYWTFDARTESAYAGQRGDAYTVQVRGQNGEVRSEIRIRWTPVRGRTARDFDDVLVLGATSLPPRYTDALHPWDLSQLQPYARDYLAGFRAEAYTVPLEPAWGQARAQIDAVIAQDVRFAIGGDQQRIERIDTRVGGVTFKHVLLPVWVAAYRYGGRPWRVVINGRTGAVRGERPYSVWKIALAVLAAAALAAGLFWLMEQGQNGGGYAPGPGFRLDFGPMR